MVDSTWAETSLDDFEAMAGAKNNIGGGYTTVLEDEFTVTMRGVWKT